MRRRPVHTATIVPVPSVSTWTLTGTPRTGGRVEVNGCDFYTFRGDRIVKKNSFWKMREP